MATRVPNVGLPDSLNNCVLTLDGSNDYLHFLQPSATVETKGVVSSYQYNRPTGLDSASIYIVPIGGHLGSDFCTVTHQLDLIGKPSATYNQVKYRVRDTGFMEPCSTADRKILSPVLVASADATLVCPRAEEQWFRAVTRAGSWDS